MSDGAGQRLFFALWPPAETIERIRAIAATVNGGGRTIPCDKWHVTLAFHGHCDARARAGLIARADCIAAAPIDLVFDRIGGFERPRITWLGMSTVPRALETLAARLQGAALGAHRFTPHITLQRGGPIPAARGVVPVTWRAAAFALVESGANGVPGAYRTVARWPLVGAGQDGSSVK